MLQHLCYRKLVIAVCGICVLIMLYRPEILSFHWSMETTVDGIGSSFWKRVFKVLDETNSVKRKIYDMKSTSAHSSFPDSMTIKNITPEDFGKIIATYKSFLFVRDPFSRLFSAYVDKIFVPTPIQLTLMNYFRRENLTSTRKLSCNSKVSFGQFSFLLAEVMLQKKHVDVHFSTTSSICDPCKLNVTLVGKMETFMPDVREVFNRAHIDISEVMGDVQDFDTANEIGSMRDVIERVWGYYLSSSVRCLTHTDTADRLWKLLQIRGFISKTIPLPLSQGNESVFSLDSYTSAAIRAYEQSEPRHMRILQRNDAMMEAYSLVTRETLEKLSLIFAEDCSLFDYSCDIDRFLRHKVSRFYFRNA